MAGMCHLAPSPLSTNIVTHCFTCAPNVPYSRSLGAGPPYAAAMVPCVSADALPERTRNDRSDA
ncbi:hypothetical protein GCM10010357_14260 [Streptomyces luteireticuli]|uniref:Uncharacterized protein n=1 Tax=Streptomyces luteireticuli TaxID=173858 RepID=A0ABN0YG50_9ACTN